MNPATMNASAALFSKVASRLILALWTMLPPAPLIDAGWFARFRARFAFDRFRANQSPHLRWFAHFAAGFASLANRGQPELRRGQCEGMAGGCLGDRHASRFCDRLSGLHQLRQLAKVNVLHDRQRRRDRQAGCRPWSWWQHTLASLEVCLIADGPR
jgi:hypothetical protein